MGTNLHPVSCIREEVFITKCAVLGALLLSFLAVPAFAQEVPGDWIGQLNSGFKVRVHLEKGASGYSGI